MNDKLTDYPAIGKYEQASCAAVNNEVDKSSAEKNLGVAHFALSSLGHLPVVELENHFRSALNYLASALKRGKSGSKTKLVQTGEWAAKVQELIAKVLDSGMKKVSEVELFRLFFFFTNFLKRISRQVLSQYLFMYVIV